MYVLGEVLNFKINFLSAILDGATTLNKYIRQTYLNT